MAVDYDRAFAEVILSRWNKTPRDQKVAAKSSDRHGQLKPDAPDSYALYDSYRYQRGHADVFREVYKKATRSPPKKGERLLVVDIGAGAATVAVALGEALKRSRRHGIDYLAFDPNRMMRKLGKQILKHLDAEFRSAKYVRSLDDVVFTGTDRLLFTFSYVAHQDAVSQTDIDEWANLIKRAVDEVDRKVELIYCTISRGDHAPPTLDDSALLTLSEMLMEAKILREQHPIDVQVQRRFPGSSRSDGQICWNKQNFSWKVHAEHWILST